MSTASFNINSQNEIYNYLKGPNLLEFLTRAHRNILGSDIKEDIRLRGIYPSFNTLSINSSIKDSKKHDNDIYILIDISDNNRRLGHATLHLIKNHIKSNTHSGPIHIVSNMNNMRRQRLTLKKRNSSTINGGIEFIPGTCMYGHCKIIGKLQIIMDSIIYVLNSYFNPNTRQSLTIHYNTSLITDDIIAFARRIEYLNNMNKYNRKQYNRTQKMKRNMYNNRM